MGRMPKSVDEHKRNGTYRECRHGKDGLPVERPEGFGLPGSLPPNGQAFWNTVTALAEYAGYITRIDGPLLRLAAERWAIYCDARDDVATTGILVDRITQHGCYKQKNPSLEVMSQSEAVIFKVLDRFGFSPRMRTALMTNLPDADDEEELAQSIFGEFGG